jgi:ABC-2 type transport system permease protein
MGVRSGALGTRRLRPGSLPWLLAHDITLNWRRFLDMFGRLPPAATLALCFGLVVLLHLLAWPIIKWLVRIMQESWAAGGSSLTVPILCTLAWMTAQGLLGAARTFHERGSLDLMLASPLPVRLVLASRALALAVSSLGSVAILVLPVANMGAVLDGPYWLAVYPALVGLALIGTAAGLAIAIALFQCFSPRRARLIAQLSAAVVGGAFLLAVQIAALLPAATRTAIAEAISSSRVATLVTAASPAWLILIGVALFAGAILALSEPFRQASLRAAGAPADADLDGSGHNRALQFGTGVAGTLRRKEWRLLCRDPNLFAQLSLQIIYTVPLAVVLVRGLENIPVATALAPAVVVIAAQIAASLAWITVSGEDAPELIAAAPVRRAEVDRAKIASIAVPLLLILALPLAGLFYLSPFVAGLVLVFAAGASTSTTLLNLWHPMPGNRRGMLRRHSQSKLMALLEHLLAMLWAIAIVFAVIGTAWAAVPIGLAGLLLLACSPARPARQAAGGGRHPRVEAGRALAPRSTGT